VKVRLAAAVLLLGLVPIGRWERTRHDDRQNDGIERVYTAVGSLESPATGFRSLESFQCLIYRRAQTLFALELCVDWQGRVVEGIDRRGGEVRIWSLREDPERARVRVDRRRFEQKIERMCAQCKAIFERARLPGGQARD
jgi:hypothetical protein